MKHSMYLVRTAQGWYQLRYSTTHEVLGCGTDVQVLLNTARKYVLKYRKVQYFNKAVHELTYRHVPKEGEKIRREYEYEHRDRYLNELLKSTISTALEDVKHDTPLNRVKKRIKRVVANIEPVEHPVTETEPEPAYRRTMHKTVVRLKPLHHN